MDFVEIERHHFPRLAEYAVDFAFDDGRPRDRELVALSPHRLDQHGEVQLAATRHAKFVRIVQLLDAQGDIVFQLGVEALLDLAARQVLALAPGERRLVDLERHADRRFVDFQRRQGLGMFAVADRVGNLQVLDTAEHDDIAGAGLLDRHPLQSAETEQVRKLRVSHRSIRPRDTDPALRPGHTAADAPDAEHTEVGAVIEARHLQLEGAVEFDLGRRHVFDDGLEQRHGIAATYVRAQAGVPLQRRRVDDREIELLLARAKPVEQVEGLVEDPAGPGAVAIDLVDHDQRREAVGEGLLGHETRLRHRALHRVDEQKHAVDHGQHALDLATEIRMPRRIDDVDTPVLPVDGGVLRQDRDASLALEIVRIHHALRHGRPLVERAGLLQQPVDEGRLAVVDMRDDRDVANFLGREHGVAAPKRGRII